MISRVPYDPPIPHELKSAADAEGIEVIGVATASGSPEHEREYVEWVLRGYHGSMEYMRRHASMKYRPEALLPNCRSVIVVGMNYYRRTNHEDHAAGGPHYRNGRVARYAWGRDYHKVLGAILKRLARTLHDGRPSDAYRVFVDSGPPAERFFAERAGAAFIAKNTLAVTSRYGSWFVLGEILSTRAFDVEERASSADARSTDASTTGTTDPSVHGGCPRGCTRCIDVCPTGALLGPYRIDASRCISYLTIEHKGVIPVELRRKMGSWVFGCDLCQEVCPLNVHAEPTAIPDFKNSIAGESIRLEDILAIQTDAEFTKQFAGSPVMRAGRRGLIRNVCIAAANLDRHDLLDTLRRLAHSTDDLIAEHARWAVDELTGRATGRA